MELTQYLKKWTYVLLYFCGTYYDSIIINTYAYQNVYKHRYLPLFTWPRMIPIVRWLIGG